MIPLYKSLCLLIVGLFFIKHNFQEIGLTLLTIPLLDGWGSLLFLILKEPTSDIKWKVSFCIVLSFYVTYFKPLLVIPAILIWGLFVLVYIFCLKTHKENMKESKQKKYILEENNIQIEVENLKEFKEMIEKSIMMLQLPKQGRNLVLCNDFQTLGKRLIKTIDTTLLGLKSGQAQTKSCLPDVVDLTEQFFQSLKECKYL